MKILFYRWKALTESDAMEAMRELGIEVVELEHPLESFNEDEKFRRAVLKKCEQENFDYLFSFNYLPVLSKIAMEKGIGYIS